MIHEVGNSILNSLERRIGKLALPQILRWIAGFQVLTWALSLFSPDLALWLNFNHAAILEGQVWRVVTWVLFPASENVLFVLIGALFMFFINDGLESAWESFRLNVYVIATVIMISVAGLVFGGLADAMNSLFYSAAFLAFASVYPNQVIHLFGVIPIKAKWLGYANGAMLLALILTSSAPILVAMFVGLAFTPFFLTFVPRFIADFRQSSASAARRQKFKAASVTESETFHECESCGATELTHPERIFRVSSDGEEYCEICRPPSG